MRIELNKTGTHVKRNIKTGEEHLKVRFDVIPEPMDKTYSIHHVQVPVIPEEGYPGEMKEGMPVDQGAYDLWIESLPKVWQTNPCLCHFVKVDADITPEQLDQIVKDIFDDNTLLQLDNTLSGDRNELRQIMKPKGGTGKAVKDVDISQINARLEVRRGD